MKSFNDFLVNDGVCSVQVVAGFVRIVRVGGCVDSFSMSSPSPRDIASHLEAWSFTSDFIERVEFVSQGVVLCCCSVSSLFRPVWSVSLPD